MRYCSLIFCFACTFVSASFGQVAFNDIGPADGTHTNATTFNAGASGALKNILTGGAFGGSVAVTNLSTVVSTTQVRPTMARPRLLFLMASSILVVMELKSEARPRCSAMFSPGSIQTPNIISRE